MPRTYDLSNEEITRRVNSAFMEFQKHDEHLLKEDLHEQCITHRLAVYLEDRFPEYHVDCEYNGNVLNTDGSRRKKVPHLIKKLFENEIQLGVKEKKLVPEIVDFLEEMKNQSSELSDEQRKAILNEFLDKQLDSTTIRSVLPDIIIHKRGSNDHNFCVIETKKSTSSVDWSYDKLKLEEYTSDTIENGLKFQLGLFIEFQSGSDFTSLKPTASIAKIKSFQNGIEMPESDIRDNPRS